MAKIDYNGEQVEIRKIGITGSTEQDSEYVLDDGSIVSLRHVVQDVYRVVDKIDRFGNPVYIVNNQVVVSVTPPAEPAT